MAMPPRPSPIFPWHLQDDAEAVPEILDAGPESDPGLSWTRAIALVLGMWLLGFAVAQLAWSS